MFPRCPRLLGRRWGGRCRASVATRSEAPEALALASALGAAGGVALLLWQVWPPRTGTLAGSLPTDLETLEAVLALLQAATPLGAGGELGCELLFVDLGSGDGRVVQAVVGRFACRGVGIDLLEESVAESEVATAAALPRALASRAAFLCADMGNVDLAEADVLFMYLPDTMMWQVVQSLLPHSGLRKGAYVLIEDAPESLRHGFGLRHVLRGGVRPVSSRHPALDLFEWRGPPARAGAPTPSPFFVRGDGPKVALSDAWQRATRPP